MYLSGVNPDGEVRGQVLDDVRDGVAGLPGSPLQDGVVGVRDAEASVVIKPFDDHLNTLFKFKQNGSYKKQAVSSRIMIYNGQL